MRSSDLTENLTSPISKVVQSLVTRRGLVRASGTFWCQKRARFFSYMQHTFYLLPLGIRYRMVLRASATFGEGKGFILEETYKKSRANPIQRPSAPASVPAFSGSNFPTSQGRHAQSPSIVASPPETENEVENRSFCQNFADICKRCPLSLL